MEDIAKAAGVSRQTIYAHFPSRDALVETLLTDATARVLTALEAADLDHGPAVQALTRFMEVAWQAFDTDPFLLHLSNPPKTPEQEREQHEPIIGPLQKLIQRGHSTGEFDPTLPVNWLLSATLALGHAAGEEVRTNRMTSEEAIAVLRDAIPRLVTNTRNEPTSPN